MSSIASSLRVIADRLEALDVPTGIDTHVNQNGGGKADGDSTRFTVSFFVYRQPDDETDRLLRSLPSLKPLGGDGLHGHLPLVDHVGPEVEVDLNVHFMRKEGVALPVEAPKPYERYVAHAQV